MRLLNFVPPGGVVASDYINNRVLAAGSAETFQAPDDARFVLFSADIDFFVKIAATDISASPAAIPAADVTDGSGAECNPTLRWLPIENAWISIVSAQPGVVALAYYAA